MLRWVHASCVIVLASCAVEEPAGDAAEVLPDDAVGPARSFSLTVTPLVPGGPATFRITGADPNQRVFLFRGTATQQGGWCPPAIAPDCLDLRATPIQQFTVRTNAQGSATVNVTVPNPVPAAAVAWQAAYRNGGGFDSSNPVSSTIYQPGSDTDGDGLTAIDEVSIHGTHPGQADSDGGGIDDGDEIAAGTDPLDPADDVPPALGAGDLISGDLVITEIMINPDPIADGDGEWFEVYNDAGADVNLRGLRIHDDATNNHVINTDVIVAAGGYAVIGINGNTALNGGVPLDYSYQGAAFVLDNPGDEVAISFNNTTISRVAYVAPPFIVTAGASINLDPSAYNETDNDSDANWCPTPTAVFGTGQRGSPGADNEVCPPPPPSFATDILPIWQANCNGCHTNGQAQAGFRADIYAQNLADAAQVAGNNMPRVAPGNAANSYLLYKLRGTQATVGGSGNRMPNGRPALPAATIQIIEDWIVGGALP